MNPKITIDLLQSQMNELCILLSDPSKHVDYDALTNYLKYYTFFMGQLGYKSKVKVSFTQEICLNCNAVLLKTSVPHKLTLPCHHCFCSEACSRNFITKNTENTLMNWPKLRCFKCGHNITRDFLNDLYGAEEFSKMLLEEAENRESKFDCVVCMNNFKVRDSITLSCNHRFCRDCLKNHIELKITEAKVSDEDMICPTCELDEEIAKDNKGMIDHNIIKGLVDKNMLEKYHKFGLDQWKPNMEDDELDFQCHGLDCQNRIIIPVTTEEYQCPACKFVSCPRCGDKAHKGCSCESYKKWKQENDQGDALFQNLIKQQGWVMCPWCNQGIERTTGCMYMSCFSTQCRGKKYLCYNCKKGLAYDHQPHGC